MDTKSLFNSIQPRYPELKGKVAIITGGSKGIGKGIAIRLAREGMKIVITGRTAETLAGTTTELKASGIDVLAVQGNIGETDHIHFLFDETMRVFGTVDLLVNNAANLKRQPFFKLTEEMFDEEMATNLKGPFLCSFRAAEIMREKKSGSIIHISSVGGLRAHNPGLPYDATKGALDAMTRVMGIELIPYGIRVNAIAPGATHTESRLSPDDPRMQDYLSRIPANRMGLPVEIGSAIAFLASDDAGYIVGQTIYIDGGITAQLSPPKYPI